MIKRLWIFLSIIFGILLLWYIKTELSNYFFEKGNIAFEEKNFSGALENHSISRFFSRDDVSSYALGKDNYYLNNFEEAEKYFLTISEKSSSGTLAQKYFALGNTSYKLGEKEEQRSIKIEAWKKSLTQYERSLQYQNKSETEENYAFVKRKLEELKEKQEENTDENKENQKNGEKNDDEANSQNEENSQSGTGSKEDSTANTSSGSQSEEAQSGSESGGEPETALGSGEVNQSNSTNENQSLSESEKKYLEGYTQFLENQQQANQKFFGGTEEGGENFNDLIDLFRNDPFFNSNLPGNNEKDW